MSVPVPAKSCPQFREAVDGGSNPGEKKSTDLGKLRGEKSESRQRGYAADSKPEIDPQFARFGIRNPAQRRIGMNLCVDGNHHGGNGEKQKDQKTAYCKARLERIASQRDHNKNVKTRRGEGEGTQTQKHHQNKVQVNEANESFRGLDVRRGLRLLFLFVLFATVYLYSLFRGRIEFFAPLVNSRHKAASAIHP